MARPPSHQVLEGDDASAGGRSSQTHHGRRFSPTPSSRTSLSSASMAATASRLRHIIWGAAEPLGSEPAGQARRPVVAADVMFTTNACYRMNTGLDGDGDADGDEALPAEEQGGNVGGGGMQPLASAPLFWCVVMMCDALHCDVVCRVCRVREIQILVNKAARRSCGRGGSTGESLQARVPLMTYAAN